MNLSALRLRIASQPLITVPYLQKLREVADGPEFYQARTELDKLIRRLKDEYSGVDPFPVAELWEYLAGRDVTPEEVALLQKVQAPRAPKAKPALDGHDLYSLMGKASGKSVVESYSWDSLKPEDQTLVAEGVKAWAAAFTKLKKYKHAEKVHQRLTKKVHLAGRPRGSEDASWDPGGVLTLQVIKGATKSALYFLVHELGHGFRELFDLGEVFDLYGPGHPPFITDYAEHNAEEDFAETFLYYSMHPPELKRKVPAKYEDMGRRIREKLP